MKEEHYVSEPASSCQPADPSSAAVDVASRIFSSRPDRPMLASAVFTAIQDQDEVSATDALQDLEQFLDPNGNNPELSREECATRLTRWLASYIEDAAEEAEIEDPVATERPTFARRGSLLVPVDLTEDVRRQLEASQMAVETLQFALNASEDSCRVLSRQVVTLKDSELRKEMAIQENEELRSDFQRQAEEWCLIEAALNARLNVNIREKQAFEEEVKEKRVDLDECLAKNERLEIKLAKVTQKLMDKDRMCETYRISMNEAAEKEATAKDRNAALMAWSSDVERRMVDEKEASSVLRDKNSKLKEKLVMMDNRPVTPVSLGSCEEVSGLISTPVNHSTPTTDIRSEMRAAEWQPKRRLSSNYATPFAKRRGRFSGDSAENELKREAMVPGDQTPPSSRISAPINRTSPENSPVHVPPICVDSGMQTDIYPESVEASMQCERNCVDVALQVEIRPESVDASMQCERNCVDIALQADIRPESVDASMQCERNCVDIALQVEIRPESVDASMQCERNCVDIALQADIRPESFEASMQCERNCVDVALQVEIRPESVDASMQCERNCVDIALQADIRPESEPNTEEITLRADIRPPTVSSYAQTDQWQVCPRCLILNRPRRSFIYRTSRFVLRSFIYLFLFLFSIWFLTFFLIHEDTMFGFFMRWNLLERHPYR